MYFAGWTATILFVPLIADKIGRKWIFFFSVFFTWVAIGVFFLSKNITTTISMMFLAGAMNSGRVMVGFIFATEFLVPKWQIIFGTAFNFIDCTTGVIITLYFDFVNRHYLYIASVGFVMTTCSVVLSLFWLRESPLWQLEMGKVD
jgi:MFS family permease